MISEDVFSQLEDTIIHKKIVLDMSFYMAQYLSSVNRENDALEIVRRAAVHDNSKLSDEELFNLASIHNNNILLKNPKILMDDQVKKKISIHWKNNRHHPEHFSSPENMDEMDLIEMVCDQYARSIQFNNDFFEFFEIRQNNRFHFSNEIYQKIIFYAKQLQEQMK